MGMSDGVETESEAAGRVEKKKESEDGEWAKRIVPSLQEPM